MKRLAFIIAILSGFTSQAQTSDETLDIVPDWQIGLVVTDVVIPALTIEGSVKISPRQHLGLKLSLPSYQSYFDTDLYQGTNWAFKGQVFQKIFLPYKENRTVILKHGPRVGLSDLSYTAETWVESERFGNPVYTYEEITGNDRNITLGYEVQLAWMSRHDWIYYELYLGLAYEQVINPESMSVLQYRDPEQASLEYWGPGYEYNGVARPILGVIIGINNR